MLCSLSKGTDLIYVSENTLQSKNLRILGFESNIYSYAESFQLFWGLLQKFYRTTVFFRNGAPARVDVKLTFCTRVYSPANFIYLFIYLTQVLSFLKYRIYPHERKLFMCSNGDFTFWEFWIVLERGFASNNLERWTQDELN